MWREGAISRFKDRGQCDIPRFVCAEAVKHLAALQSRNNAHEFHNVTVLTGIDLFKSGISQ